MRTISKTTACILMLAFGCHELFEGIAFGLLKSTNVALQLAVGIVIHKTCAAVAVGAAFAKTDLSLKMICLYIFAFSLTTPVGAAIGMKLATVSDLLNVIFMSLSAGTFIYVAASEIIVHEFESPRWSGVKIVLAVVGAAVIFSLWFLHGEEE